MKHELVLPLPPWNLPVKFGTNPSTIFLVVVVTDRHTDTQNNAGENILPRFRGDNNSVVITDDTVIVCTALVSFQHEKNLISLYTRGFYVEFFVRFCSVRRFSFVYSYIKTKREKM